MLQAKLKQGYVPSPLDRKNLMIIMKRTFKKDVNPDISDVELLRMYLQLVYAKEVKMQQQKKRKTKDSQMKLKRLVQILEESEVKQQRPTKMGSHHIKLVK
jgi:hypothetical protein